MQALFDDSKGIGEIIEESFVDSEDFDEEFNTVISKVDPEYIADIYAAHEICEEVLSKVSLDKKEDPLKKVVKNIKEGLKNNSSQSKTALGKTELKDKEDKPTEPNLEFL